MRLSHTLTHALHTAAVAAATAVALAGLATTNSPIPATAVASAQSAKPAPPAEHALSSRYVDELGRPTTHTIEQIEAFAAQPFVPTDVANALRTALGFFAGTGEAGGPPLPEDAPTFTQFYWPTVASNCIGDGLHSTASALVVAGPTETPAPGAGPGEATFVFTALGTPAAAADQGLMNVYWVNLDTGRSGITPLANHQINPQGPATLSTTADTGSGRVIAVVDGSVRTTENTCKFAPTAASFSVR